MSAITGVIAGFICLAAILALAGLCIYRVIAFYRYKRKMDRYNRKLEAWSDELNKSADEIDALIKDIGSNPSD